MKTRTLRDLGGQRLGQLNYSPSCFNVQLPWDMATNKDFSGNDHGIWVLS